MATDTQLLQGEVLEDLEQQFDVERMLAGFLRSLLDEQGAEAPAPAEVSS